MTSPRTLIVVLNYQGETKLFPCLASIVPLLEAGDMLLVIDNGQEAALMRRVQAEFPMVQVHTLPQNVGFATGMNVGIKQALENDFEAVWLLNNDTVVHPEALLHLKAAMRQLPGLELFSPLIVTPAGRPWFAGGVINTWRMRTEHRQTWPTTSTPFPTHFLTGCALFIPRATLEEVGLLNERYFLYYEDADYSVRTLAQGGRLWVVPQSRVVHTEASTENPEKIYWLVRSGVEFFFHQTRGWSRLWIEGWYRLRRLKNRLHCWLKPTVVARSVERAYTEARIR